MKNKISNNQVHDLQYPHPTNKYTQIIKREEE